MFFSYFNKLHKDVKIVICSLLVSYILLLFFSPLSSIGFLFLPTLYFLYKGKYKNIGLIWIMLFWAWYLFFTGCLIFYNSPYDPIWIGDDCSFWILKYLKHEHWRVPQFKKLCIQTLFILDRLSLMIGFPFYIPSIYKGLFFLVKFINKWVDKWFG